MHICQIVNKLKSAESCGLTHRAMNICNKFDEGIKNCAFMIGLHIGNFFSCSYNFQASKFISYFVSITNFEHQYHGICHCLNGKTASVSCLWHRASIDVFSENRLYVLCVFVMCSASVSVYIMWVKKEGSGTDGGTNSPHGSFSDAGSLAA